MSPTLEPPVRLSALPSANGTHPAAPSPGLARRVVGWLAHSVPTALAFGLLIGAGWWGHSTGWKMPKRATLAGTAEAVTPDDWCAEHGVPESACVECDDKLMPRPPAYGWCRTHGVSNCPTCHPDVAQVSGPPDPMPYNAAGPLALLPRTPNSPKCELHMRRLQFATVAAADKAGIDVDVVGLRPMTEAVIGHGELGYDPTTVVRLSPRAGGSVWRVFKQVGDPVAVGEVVAVVESVEVGKAKTEYVNAAVQVRLTLATVDRMRAVSVSAVEKQTAEAMAEEARLRRVTAAQTLTNLGLALPEGLDAGDPASLLDKLRHVGLPDGLRDAVGGRPASNNLLPVVAPQAGVMTAVSVVAGEVVDPTRVLAVAADTRKLWLILNVRQDELQHVALGQTVKFRADAGGDELAGVVSWISPAVDERTRTVPVRVEVANPGGKLRANTFVAGRVVLRD